MSELHLPQVQDLKELQKLDLWSDTYCTTTPPIVGKKNLQLTHYCAPLTSINSCALFYKTNRTSPWLKLTWHQSEPLFVEQNMRWSFVLHVHPEHNSGTLTFQDSESNVHSTKCVCNCFAKSHRTMGFFDLQKHQILSKNLGQQVNHWTAPSHWVWSNRNSSLIRTKELLSTS